MTVKEKVWDGSVGYHDSPGAGVHGFTMFWMGVNPCASIGGPNASSLAPMSPGVIQRPLSVIYDGSVSRSNDKRGNGMMSLSWPAAAFQWHPAFSK